MKKRRIIDFCSSPLKSKKTVERFLSELDNVNIESTDESVSKNDQQTSSRRLKNSNGRNLSSQNLKFGSIRKFIASDCEGASTTEPVVNQYILKRKGDLMSQKSKDWRKNPNLLKKRIDIDSPDSETIQIPILNQFDNSEETFDDNFFLEVFDELEDESNSKIPEVKHKVTVRSPEGYEDVDLGSPQKALKQSEFLPSQETNYHRLLSNRRNSMQNVDMSNNNSDFILRSHNKRVFSQYSAANTEYKSSDRLEKENRNINVGLEKKDSREPNRGKNTPIVIKPNSSYVVMNNSDLPSEPNVEKSSNQEYNNTLYKNDKHKELYASDSGSSQKYDSFHQKDLDNQCEETSFGHTGHNSSFIDCLYRKNDKNIGESGPKRFEFLDPILDAQKNPVGSANYDPKTLYISKKDFDKLSNFEKQFWDIKRKYFNTVIFFKKGKFYELFEHDADIGASFGLKLTQRVNMRMAGIPESSFNDWAIKFLKAGYQIGRVDQRENMIGKKIRQNSEKNKKLCEEMITKLDRDSNSKYLDEPLIESTISINHHKEIHTAPRKFQSISPTDNEFRCPTTTVSECSKDESVKEYTLKQKQREYNQLNLRRDDYYFKPTSSHRNSIDTSEIGSLEHTNEEDSIVGIFEIDDESSSECHEDTQLSPNPAIIERELKEVITPGTIYDQSALSDMGIFLGVFIFMNDIYHCILYDASTNTAFLHICSTDNLLNLFTQYKIPEIISNQKIDVIAQMHRAETSGSLYKYQEVFKKTLNDIVNSLLINNRDILLDKKTTSDFYYATDTENTMRKVETNFGKNTEAEKANLLDETTLERSSELTSNVLPNISKRDQNHSDINIQSAKFLNETATLTKNGYVAHFLDGFLALYNYLSYLKRKKAFDTITIKRLCSIQKYLILDSSAIKHLDLLENKSLFGTINHCKTVQGKRLMKNWMLRPLANERDIMIRQDATKTLSLLNGESISRYLKVVPDTQRNLTRLFNPNPTVKTLKTFIENIKAVNSFINAFENIMVMSFGNIDDILSRSIHHSGQTISESSLSEENSSGAPLNTSHENHKKHNLLPNTNNSHHTNNDLSVSLSEDKTNIFELNHPTEVSQNVNLGLRYLIKLLRTTPRLDSLLLEFDKNFAFIGDEITIHSLNHPVYAQIENLRQSELELVKYLENEKKLIEKVNSTRLEMKEHKFKSEGILENHANTHHLNSSSVFSSFHDTDYSRKLQKISKNQKHSANFEICFRDLGKDVFQIEVPAHFVMPNNYFLVSSTKEKKRYYTNDLKRLVNIFVENEEILYQKKSLLLKRIISKLKRFKNMFVQADSFVSKIDCLFSFSIFNSLNPENSSPIFIPPASTEIPPATYPYPESAMNYLLKQTKDKYSCKDEKRFFYEFEEIKSPMYPLHVPNTLKMYKKVAVITGPNMGGKSTTIKSIALNIILAQMGMKVFAKNYKAILFDRIFTKLGTSDNLLEKKSTFQVELEDTAKILNQSTNQSFIIIDELGRGTSTKDGECIAKAVLNWLVRNGRTCLFSTHYTKILSQNFGKVRISDHIAAEYDFRGSNISLFSEDKNESTKRRNSPTKHHQQPLETILKEENSYLKSTYRNDFVDSGYMTVYLRCILGKDLLFLYTIQEGICEESQALEVSKLAGVHPEILKRAAVYKSALTKKNE